MSAILRSLVIAKRKWNAKTTIQPRFARMKTVGFQDVEEDTLKNANTLNLATENSKNLASMIIQ